MWVVAVASALMYVTRYAINSWGVLYLQEIRGYSLVDAGFQSAHRGRHDPGSKKFRCINVQPECRNRVAQFQKNPAEIEKNDFEVFQPVHSLMCSIPDLRVPEHRSQQHRDD